MRPVNADTRAMTSSFLKKNTCLLLLPVVIAAMSCTDTAQHAKTHPAATPATATGNPVVEGKALLQDGMLVTRSDDDYESLALMNMQQYERAYSHAGIVFKEDTNWYVYHIMTGAENPSGKCRRDAFDSFVNPLQKTGYGLFSYHFTAVEKQALHAWYKKQFAASPPFDIYFNLGTNDSLYCTEMIYKGIAAATNQRIQIPISIIENFKPKMMGYDFSKVFFKRFEYVGIDNLYLNPFCTEIKRFRYR
jgi:hypothetical protein